MAGKRYGRRGGYKKGSIYRGGKYNFTAKRRRALERAAYISARKRKGSGHAATAKKVAVLAGVAGVAYLGYRNRTTIAATTNKWRDAFNPARKEQTRINSSISVAPPSQTTVISLGALRAAQETRDALDQARLPPHMGGPDRRIYNEDDTVNTEAMTEGSVKRTLAANRRRTRGKKTGSLQGTPGGRQRPPKANPANKPKESEYQDFVWENDVLVPVGRGNRPTNLPSLSSAPQLPGRTRPAGMPRADVGRSDPLYVLEGMKRADERLLSGQDAPTSSGVAPVEFRAPNVDKPATSSSRSKPKAPTTNTAKAKDSKPAPKPRQSAKLEGGEFKMDQQIEGWDKLNAEEKRKLNERVAKQNRDWRIDTSGQVYEIPW